MKIHATYYNEHNPGWYARVIGLGVDRYLKLGTPQDASDEAITIEARFAALECVADRVDWDSVQVEIHR
jgi:hypothetical protein